MLFSSSYGTFSGERPATTATITYRAMRNSVVALVSSAVMILLIALVWCNPERLEMQGTLALVSEVPDASVPEKEVVGAITSIGSSRLTPPSEADVASFKPKASLFLLSHTKHDIRLKNKCKTNPNEFVSHSKLLLHISAEFC